MGAPESVSIHKIIQALKSVRSPIIVGTDFETQVDKVRKMLKNDKSGIISPVYDFMVHSANVPFKIETENETFDSILKEWQNKILNKDMGISIPRGLKALSEQYYRERWTTSNIVLKASWDRVKIGDYTLNLPTDIWFLDGKSVTSKPTSDLSKKEFFINKTNPLKVGTKESLIIRRPYNSWYEVNATPYFLRRGVLFNFLLKSAIMDKQVDVIEAIVPYLLLVKSGTDKLAELQQLASQEDLEKLRDSLKQAIEEKDTYTGDIGKLIASLSYDANLEHFMPDLGKVFNSSIFEACDKNILGGLGLIELQGFSSNRQETILNPKVLVEEITDAVIDWSEILNELSMQIIERNQSAHPRLISGTTYVKPGKVKTFITDDMRSMVRSLYDRGIISKESTSDLIADLDFEIEVQKRTKEQKRGLDKTMYPPIIQNLEQHPNDTGDEEVLDDRTPGSPEADNFNQAFIAQHKNKKIENLPDEIADLMPKRAQEIFINAFNKEINDLKSVEAATVKAKEKLSETYKECSTGKWRKIRNK